MCPFVVVSPEPATNKSDLDTDMSTKQNSIIFQGYIEVLNFIFFFCFLKKGIFTCLL